MHTSLHANLVDNTDAQQAADIIKACVHCGFCNATCPTYLELGDERDGPRGRIYLIKQFLEEGSATANTVSHLDSCLTCRACETTCPSGVEYGNLVDLGRHMIEEEVPRPFAQRAQRWALLKILPFKKRFGLLLSVGQFFKPVLPQQLAKIIPVKQSPQAWPNNKHLRTMLVLEGCAQAAATPNTNSATARVLDRLGITLIGSVGGGCCGAASYHLSAHEQAKDFARRNIDAWWPGIERGAEAIVLTASGCGTLVKDYGSLLKDDAEYAQKAAKVGALAKDISEILVQENIAGIQTSKSEQKVAAHCPCSLQHGQQTPSAMASVLASLGVNAARTKDDHLCCGSAGSYSLLQPAMSSKLLANKINALSLDNPDQIVTANVGCQMHLASEASVPVKHWVELVEQLTSP